ncbi:hypothetical protein BN946_scf184615.g15 [Trametes cinnabarina]|uniref:Uncharacterized protein n=1 Tax=Pycnoporus cinnabarinus TaxID=5643 RepID=A0A060SW90_PYCCI|nr:hypothetical protein BN946_scf184615.g15 [Trametes cinnabarina]
MLRSLSQRIPRPRRASDTLPSPTNSHDGRVKPWWAPLHNRRTLRLVIFALLCLFVIRLYVGVDTFVEVQLDKDRKPPLYEEYHKWELALPQHNPDLPYPEGRNGQYIWMANHVHASGWGNAMQEHLLNAHLAYKAGRALVFDNYTWNNDGSDYSEFNGHLIPSRIPLAAIIRGPSAGGPFPPGDSAPRAVVKEYFDQVCPPSERVVMSSDEVTDVVGKEADAGRVLDAWVEKLRGLPRCMEISEFSTQIFDIWTFGSKRVLGIWPSLKTSPILTQFRWSQLIEDAFTANRDLFSSSSWFSWLTKPVYTPTVYPYDVIPGLLVLHVRRGDFEGHCLHFARWSSQWNGFNSFPELPDKFVPPPIAAPQEASEEVKQVYLRHCFPDIRQIVERVQEIRRTPAGKGLKNIYIMTNGKKPWLEELKIALRRTGGWDKIASSRDLKLNWEQQFVAQSVDMLIGERAQVLIGNGFSSLTSNIVMMRMARDIPPEANRFW